MNPTLYDVLGVSQDASRDDIRKAWRDAADRFQPGDGGSTSQFRLFNEAADVLLDPERRKEYDARLAGRVAGRSAATTDGAGVSLRKPKQSEPESTESGTVEPVLGGFEAGAPRSGVPAPVLVVLAALAALAVGLAAFLVTQSLRAEAYKEALDRAPAAAENAATAVLSYGYKSLESDRDAAARFLSEDYRKQYVETFDKLVQDGATESKATVKAEVLASSAMVTGEERDPDRVPVLLFVNQTTTSAATGEQPSVALNRVRLDMVRSDGSWLVDGITSY